MVNCLSSKLLFLNDSGLIVFFQSLSSPALPPISFNLVKHWMLSACYKEVEAKAVFVLQILHEGTKSRLSWSSVALSVCMGLYSELILTVTLGDQEGLVSHRCPPHPKSCSLPFCVMAFAEQLARALGISLTLKNKGEKMLQNDLLLTRTLSNLSELLE